jgi:hypothetical protein
MFIYWLTALLVQSRGLLYHAIYLSVASVSVCLTVVGCRDATQYYIPTPYAFGILLSTDETA